MNHRARLYVVLLAALAATTALAQNKRDTQVREDRQKLGDSEDWIYNDLDDAVAAAQQAKKPLLVVFR